MIKFKQIFKIYPSDCRALEDINLHIKKGEFITIAGRSGAGKSTLIKLLIREDAPTHGQILWGKQDIHLIRNSDLPFWRRQIGMVFQDFRLLPEKTAFENIAFAMEVSGRTKEEIERDVPQLLKLVNLTERAEHFPDQLSGGEKQRIAIARALAHRPKVLIADEPTGNLDPIHTWDIIRLLIRINELGTTVILATHDREIISGLDRRVVTLDCGRIVKDEIGGKGIM